MVLTVEPGLYFKADDLTVPVELRGIGIRIEDDVLVTANGYEILSDGVPREPDELLAWMADQVRSGPAIRQDPRSGRSRMPNTLRRTRLAACQPAIPWTPGPGGVEEDAMKMSGAGVA